jgi:hypothetical protein
MTGDHHGRTAARATLLVTATDEILGTHSTAGHAMTICADQGESLDRSFCFNLTSGMNGFAH